MALGLPAFTLLSTADELFGWLKRVVSPFWISKLCQLMIAFCVCCWIVSVLPAECIDTEPATTVPFCGLAIAWLMARGNDKQAKANGAAACGRGFFSGRRAAETGRRGLFFMTVRLLAKNSDSYSSDAPV